MCQYTVTSLLILVKGAIQHTSNTRLYPSVVLDVVRGTESCQDFLAYAAFIFDKFVDLLQKKCTCASKLLDFPLLKLIQLKLLFNTT